MSDTEKTILLTGASGGIGLSLVDYLLSHTKYRLVMQYRAKFEALLPILAKHDLAPEEVCYKADLTDETQVQEMVMKIDEEFKPIWGLINLAGATSNAMSWKLPLSEFNSIVAANLNSTFLMCRSVAPLMRQNNGGRIINVSSIVSQTGVAGASHYCAAKAGINGFTKSLALELANKNIAVNSLALGYFDCGIIDTVPQNIQESIKQRIPLGRFGRVSEIGSLVNYLMSEGSAYMTGHILNLNGGLYL